MMDDELCSRLGGLVKRSRLVDEMIRWAWVGWVWAFEVGKFGCGSAAALTN